MSEVGRIVTEFILMVVIAEPFREVDYNAEIAGCIFTASISRIIPGSEPPLV